MEWLSNEDKEKGEELVNKTKQDLANKDFLAMFDDLSKMERFKKETSKVSDQFERAYNALLSVRKGWQERNLKLKAKEAKEKILTSSKEPIFDEWLETAQI